MRDESPFSRLVTQLGASCGAPLPPFPKIRDRLRVVRVVRDGPPEIVRYAAVRGIAKASAAEITLSDGRVETRFAAHTAVVQLQHLGARQLHRDARGWYVYAEEAQP